MFGVTRPTGHRKLSAAAMVAAATLVAVAVTGLHIAADRTPAHATAYPYQPGVIYFSDWNPELNLADTINTKRHYFRSEDPFGGVRDLLTAPGPFNFGPKPDREPLQGFYDDRQQSVMDTQILQAASRGIDHFAFYYYENIHGGGQINPGQQAVSNFRSSAYKSLMKFYLMFVTTGDWSASDWQSIVVPNLVSMMQDPQYKRTPDGHPLVAFFGDLRAKLGGDTQLASGLSALRTAATSAGLPTPFLVADPDATPGAGFDGLLPLNSGKNSGYGTTQLLGNGASQFDYTPWRGIGYQEWLNGVSNGQLSPSTPNQFRSGPLAQAKNNVDTRSGSYGISTFYAWNETGEGGVIEPNTYFGYGFLNAIQDTFHLDNTPYKNFIAAHGLPNLDPSVRLEFAPDRPYHVPGSATVISGTVTNQQSSPISGTVTIAAPSGWTTTASSGTTFTNLAAGTKQTVSFTLSPAAGTNWTENTVTLNTVISGQSYSTSTFVVLADTVHGVVNHVAELPASGGTSTLTLDLRNYSDSSQTSSYTLTTPAGWTLNGGGTGTATVAANGTTDITGKTLAAPSGLAPGLYDVQLAVTTGGTTSTSLLQIKVNPAGYRWEWSNDNNTEGWSGGSTVQSDIYDVVSTNNDPQIYSPGNLNLSPTNKYVNISLQNLSSSANAQIFFTTTTDTAWSEDKSLKFTISTHDVGLRNYIIDMSQNPKWAGTISQIRFDPIDAAGVVNMNHVYVSADPNLALEQDAFASDVFGPGSEAGHAVDGTVGPYEKWTSTRAAGDKWLEVDLGQSYAVNRWNVQHAGAGGEYAGYNTRDFKLQAFVSGSWTDVDTVAGNTANATDRTFASVSAQRWRLYITSPNNGIDNAARINEFSLYGATFPAANTGLNLLAGKTTTADSYYTGSQAPGYATDGTTATKWNSALGSTHWLQVDIGQACTLTRYVVKHANPFETWQSQSINTRDFQLQVADNTGGPWTSIDTVTGNTADVTDHTVSSGGAHRYVRLSITNPQTETSAVSARIYEFEAYGSC